MFYPRSSGSGTSGTGVNFILNPDAESDTSGWATYQDAAGATPVDGTGGAPTVTWTRSTSSPLTGTASFVLTKDAANRQGEGASYAFTIDSASQARVLAINFDFIVGSGTFVAGASGVDSDVEVYIYDVTNAVVIQPSSYKLFSNSSTISGHFSANFQSASNSTSYRLILHCATTSASAYTLKFDTVQVGPSSYVYGTPITDWLAFTPTVGGWVDANHTNTGFWRRVGGDAEYEIKVATSGAPTSATLTLNLPSGHVIDTTRIVNTTANSGSLGIGTVNDSGASIYPVIVGYLTTTSVAVAVVGTASSYGGLSNVTQAVPMTFGAGDQIDVKFTAPILGWSSSVQMSDSADQRVVAARMTGATATVTNSYSDITWTTIANDTHGAMGAISYTVPVPGYYDISGSVNIGASTVSAAGGFFVGLHNGTSVILDNEFLFDLNVPENESIPFTYGSVLLSAGTAIKVQIKTSGTIGTPVINSSATLNYLAIKRLSGPSAIGASETVAASYSTVAGVTLTTAFATVNYNTLGYDTHGAYASSVYMTPSAGRYEVNAAIGSQPFNVAGSTFGLFLIANKGATQFAGGWAVGSGATMSLFATLDGSVNCNAGETLAIQVKAAAAIIGYTGFGFNTFTVKRIGI